MAGSHEVQKPCRDCPEGEKKDANYPDEGGKTKVLCAKHAHNAGCHRVMNPCRDCPEGEKMDAAYPDEEGKKYVLCAEHAHAAGSHQVINPCRDCPEGEKKQGHYPDEQGRNNILCAEHAHIAGCHLLRNPCRDCHEDTKKEAHFPDEEGRKNILCAPHAVEAGTLSARHPGASRQACEFFDDWFRLTREHIPHIHFRPGCDPEGMEVQGLVPGRKLRPDGHVDGSGVVWLFHGCWYHGYPPCHPKHESSVARGRWGPDVYAQTMQQMEEYKAVGLRVLYVWSCEYEETHPPYPRALRTIVHEA